MNFRVNRHVKDRAEEVMLAVIKFLSIKKFQNLRSNLRIKRQAASGRVKSLWTILGSLDNNWPDYLVVCIFSLMSGKVGFISSCLPEGDIVLLKNVFTDNLPVVYEVKRYIC